LAIDPKLRSHSNGFLRELGIRFENLEDAISELNRRVTELENEVPEDPEDPEDPEEPDPPVDPGDELTNPSVGVGLGGIQDWSTQWPFLNIAKTARPWTAHRPGSGWGGIGAAAVKAASGPDGHLLRMPEGATHVTLIVLTELPAAMTSAAGRYRLRWTGAGRPSIAMPNVTYGNGEAWFDYTPRGSGSVMIDIREIDPADPIRIESIVHERHVALFDTGEVLNPEWIAVMRDMRVLRFMDWARTNNSTVARWADRATPDSYTWGDENGVPLEVQIEAANRVGADPWFNIPHLADDDYIRRHAELVKARLDKRLKAFVEYSNEVWNFIFAQARWADGEGKNLWPNDAEAWVRYYALRSTNMARIYREVFADAPERLEMVLTMHTGWRGLEQAILYDKQGTDHPARYHDCYAVTGYFGYGLDATPWLDLGETEAMNRAFDALGREVEGLAATFAYHKAESDKAGLRMVMYEGGTHVLPANDRVAALYAKMHRDPRMGALYRRLLEIWRAAGGHEHCLFVAMFRHTLHGYWGMLEHMDDRSPRWDAVTAFNAAHPGDWEARAPGTFLGTTGG